VSDTNNINVSITASTGELNQGMQQGASAVRSGADQMRDSLNGLNGATTTIGRNFASFLSNIRSSMGGASQSTGTETANIGQHFTRLTGSVGGAVSGLQGQLGALSKAVGFVSSNFAALAGIAAGVGIFKEGINESKKFTGEAMGLAKALNIGATEAGTLNVALGDIYSSSETVIEGTQHLARQLRQNEDGLKAMGLKTRDASGEYRNMRDLLFDAVKVMGTYKEGTDRALAGQTLFGKGAAEVGGLIKLNNQVLEDAAEKQKELGLTVTKEGVEATKAYKAAMNDVGDVMSALKKTIGDAVMPIFTKFGQWLSTTGPAAVTIVHGAISGLSAAFWYLKNGVVVVWETINAMVVSVAEPIRALAASIYKAAHGDWSGAKDEITGVTAVIASAWSNAMDEMGKSTDEVNEKVHNLFMPGTEMKATDTSKQKSYVDPSAGKDQKAKDERMKLWEADLLKQKTQYMLENDMREMSIADEETYWQKILATLKKGDNQTNAVKKKIAEADFQQTKVQADQRKNLLIEVVDFESKLEQSKLDEAKQASDDALARGEITNAQALTQEERYVTASYQIAVKAQRDKLALLDKDPERNVVERQKVLDQMLLLEKKHAIDVNKLRSQQTIEARKYYTTFGNSVQQGFQQNLAGLLSMTQSWGGFMRGMFSSLTSAFANMVASWITDMAKNAIMQRVTQSTTGVAQVLSNAAVAASAAFASTAAIPMVGPMMAPGASAAAYAATAAYAPLASARNGFDIPAGVNPLTQLHEKEMVLPAKQADVIRNMADNGGGAGGGDINLHVHAVDAKSVERLFRDNAKHLVTALQAQRRNFVKMG
jgi:hypothetical protein